MAKIADVVKLKSGYANFVELKSEKLSGRKPEYQLIDDAELKLTIFVAKPPQ